MFRKTAIAHSVALAIGAITTGALVSPAAYAQSNTTGTIYGQVAQPSGAEILAENVDSGIKRTVRPDASGRFSLVSLPTGIYRVSLIRNGAVVEKRENVEVIVSQGSEISFAGVQVVEVRGSGIRKLDLTSAGSTTVFTAKDLERVPVASNVGAVIQLAPNTTRGDSRYGNSNGGGAPSFGGASASENAYYINGFPVTTLLTQVGFSQLPFNSIAQAQVLTGGYGAEFGRSTGGVVNLITKRGGNQFEAGGAISFEPSSLRAKERDQLYENNGTTLDGKYRWYNQLNKQDRTVISAYASGPIVKDKLFFFASVEQTKLDRDQIRTANTSATYVAPAATISSSFQERDVTTPRYLIKLDYALTDDHQFEYTRISDKVKDDRKYFGFDYRTLQRTDVQNGGVKYLNWGPAPTVAAAQGAVVDILKYTGYVTQDLTLTALIGQTKTDHDQKPDGYNPSLPQVLFPGDVQAPSLAGQYTNFQTATGTILVPGAYDKNKGARVDIEYKLSSSHLLRGGIDYNKIQSKAGTSTAGGSVWTYGKTDPAVPLDGSTQPTNSVLTNPLAQAGYYVARTVSSTSATPTVIQTAEYIEDKWQVNKDTLLVLGLRNEGFDNRNGDNQSFVKLSKQLAPRISATWDPIGDQSTKLFGSVGRYHVPLPTNVAVRGAGSSLNTTENFVYTGIDPATGAPTGLTPISPRYSANNEFGQAKDPRTVAGKNLKGNYQDELALGIERALAPGLNGGAKFTYRTLKTAIDDHCDNRPFLAWAARNNVDVEGWSGKWTSANPAERELQTGYSCALFNPGLDNTFELNLRDLIAGNDGKLTSIHLTAAELGLPKVKRTYMALDFFLEHPFDGKWTGKVTYTYSKNKGNAEGQLLSDIGQGDVSTTQNYDYPEFSVNANGLLPNDRTHKIKAFGYYQATSEFGIGGTLVLSSGRPKNCIGNAPVPVAQDSDGNPIQTPYGPGSPVTNYSGYGSAYFFCNGQASTRGTAGKLPTEFNFDTSLVYAPEYVKGLRLRVDIFNLFNRQVAEVVEERYNSPGGASTVWNRYNTVESYSAPRSVKFTAAYDIKF